MKSEILEKMFNLDTILLDFEADNSDDFLIKISDFLCQKGYVKESYKEAIITREHAYPTGLPTQSIVVAMPHTDIEHAIIPNIAVIKFAHEVPFKEMANDVNIVQAKMAFVLIVTEPKSQVKTLQALMELFCKEGSLERIYASNTKEKLLNALLEEMQK